MLATRPSMRRLPWGSAAIGLLLWSLSPGMNPGAAAETPRAAEAPRPVRHTVTIDATSYRPKTLTVRPGDSVVWVNHDLLVHTATAKNGGFDSKDIPAGGSWTHKVTAEGLFAYGCNYHPTMKGTLRVR